MNLTREIFVRSLAVQTYCIKYLQVLPSDEINACSGFENWSTNLFMCTSKYTYDNCHFSSSGTSLRARAFVRNAGWGEHNSTFGITLPEVWARSVHCVARGKPSKLFWPWAHLRQIPGFSQHPRGLGFARRGYTYISLFLHRAPRYDPTAQQRSSPLAAAACNSTRVWLLL